MGKKVFWFKTGKVNIEDYAASFANAGIFGWVKGAVLSWLSAMACTAF
ncbi:hypothetical protein [Clostridium ragsdalei]|nr:hypothetical protein [Clostridium ragsdalei]